MIIDLTVENFRSIKDEQVLSLYVEQPRSHLTGHIAYPAGDKIGVLRSAGIYGANASGKSNVLRAFRALRYLICGADLKEGDSIACYEPYKLSDQTKEAPVRFEIEFVNTDGIRYSYSISFNKNTVLEESLDFYPSRQRANIFRRTPTDTWEDISFGGLYKGGAKRIPFFPNNTYLGTAGKNPASADIIRSVYNYFRKTLRYIGAEKDVYTANFLDDESMMNKAARFLCLVDTGISGVQSRINKIEKDELLESLPEEMQKMLLEQTKRSFFFAHRTESGKDEYFRERDESEGTQKLFSILPLLLRAFESGGVMLLDEIDNSFHPHIAELVIRLFNDPAVNTTNAQLIFSTHNVHLMSADNMRRDQIWFVQKNEGSSMLYSLDEFDKEKVKSGSPFGIWYNEGRFGAIPTIDYAGIANLLRSDSIESSLTTATKTKAIKPVLRKGSSDA